MKRSLIAILAMLALVGAAHAFGLGKLGANFGALGVIGKAPAAAVTPGCNGTGLIFTSACNSQYIGIL